MQAILADKVFTAGNDPDRMKGALYVLGSKTL